MNRLPIMFINEGCLWIFRSHENYPLQLERIMIKYPWTTNEKVLIKQNPLKNRS